MDEYIGLQTTDFMEGKLIFYPGFKYVLQYAILYYIYCYALNYKKETIIKLDFLSFMSDVFKLFDIITNNKAEYKECSGRSCFNLFNVELKTLKKLHEDGILTTDKINVNQFVDSIRYATKRLFIGAVMNSYDNRRSELVKCMLYRSEDLKITSNQIMDYGYVDKKKKLMYQDENDSSKYYEAKSYNGKTFQPYYSMDEIITSTIQDSGITNMKTNEIFDDDLGSQYISIANSFTSYDFHFGLFDKWDNSNYFEFSINSLDTSLNIENIINADNLVVNHSSGKKINELMFDYYDEIDMVKVRRSMEQQYSKVNKGNENKVVKYVSTTMRFETWGYANDTTSVYISNDNIYNLSSDKIELKFYFDHKNSSRWIDANENVWDGNITGSISSDNISLSITTVPGYLEVFEKAYSIDGKYVLDDDDYTELCKLWLKNII